MKSVAIATLSVLLQGCDRAPPAPAPPGNGSATSLAAPRAPAASSPVRDELPAALSGDPLVALEVPGFLDAVVSVPIGAREARPLVVALHGNYDRPEWQCDVWRGVSAGFPFVLCPRGVPREDAPRSAERFTYTAAKVTFQELEEGRSALRARYPEHVEAGSPVLVAFSLGAIYAAREIVERPAAFPFVALVEGGYDGWTTSRVRRYAEGGGKRVLFACAQTVCRNAARNAVPLFAKYGAEARVEYAPGAGHTYDGEVARRVAAQWDWLLGSRVARIKE